MAKQMVVTIVFTAPLPVSQSALREYVIEALESSGGMRHPDDPLFSSLCVQNLKFLDLQKEAA